MEARVAERECAGHYSGDSETERNEGGRVIDETFPFEDYDDLAWHPQMLRHGEGSHRVRWRYDGTEHKTDSQGQTDQRMENERCRPHSQQHESDGQEENRAQVCAEVSP